MSSLTPYLSMYLPAPGDGSENGQTWGPQVNANFTAIDSKLHEFVSIFDFLTENQKTIVRSRTGSAAIKSELTAAFSAAYAASSSVWVPDGVYTVSSLPNFIKKNTRIIGIGHPIINYTGVDDGLKCDTGETAYGTQDFYVHIENLRITGVSTPGKAGLIVRGIHYSVFREIQVDNFDIGLREAFGICNTFDNFNCVGFNPDTVGWVPYTWGVVVEGRTGGGPNEGASTESVFLNCHIGNGLNGVHFINADHCRWFGGNIEANTNVGMVIEQGSNANIISCDLESNGNVGNGYMCLQIKGLSNTVLNSIVVGTVQILEGGRHNNLKGGIFGSIYIGAGALYAGIHDTCYNANMANTGTFTDLGAWTTIVNVSNYEDNISYSHAMYQNKANKLAITGGLTSDKMTLKELGANVYYGLSGSAGTGRSVYFQTDVAGVDTGRWAITVDSTAESGGNAGSNLSIAAYSDAGVAIDGVIQCNRVAGGLMTLNRPIQANSTMKIVGNVGFNGTAPMAKPTITGAKAGNAALTSLLSALHAYGFVNDTTT